MSKPKRAIGLSTALLLIAGLGIGAWQFMNHKPSKLANESLKNLAALNYEHQMVLEELVAPEDAHTLVAELLTANSFDLGQMEADHRGLIVSLDEEDSGYMMLRPVKEVSDLELESIANKYESNVDEFAAVEVDQDLFLQGEPVYWGADESNIFLATEEPGYDYKGPVRIAIVDSGVDIEHNFFKLKEFDQGWNSIDDNSDTYDDIGHGTHVAGIAAAYAPGAEIVPYKIYNNQGGRLSYVIEAVDKAIEDEVDIMNMSFGVLAPSYALESSVKKAARKGVVIVAAAGNNGSDSGFYPASYADTFSVASVDSEGLKLPKSNYGNWVDYAAYGYQVRSTLPGNTYGHKSGNSQSTAFVSAAIARILATTGLEESLSLDEIRDILEDDAELIREGDLAGVSIVR